MPAIIRAIHRRRLLLSPVSIAASVVTEIFCAGISGTLESELPGADAGIFSHCAYRIISFSIIIVLPEE